MADFFNTDDALTLGLDWRRSSLLALSDAGRVELAVTAYLHDDIPSDPLAARLGELRELGIDEAVPYSFLDAQCWVVATYLGAGKPWDGRSNTEGAFRRPSVSAEAT
jgi:hypothetical protein